MKLKIYQIISNESTRNFIFQELKYVRDTCSGRIPSECYECVYSGEVVAETLEDVFTIFNIRHPNGYRGRSLSISDVVEVVSGAIEPAVYYCDRFGFEKITFEKEHCIGRHEDE